LEKFSVLKGIAAPLPVPNVNTDVLIRIERLVELPRGQLAPYCFEAWRYRPDGSDDPDFILNKSAFQDAKILLCGPNFGCGSSREAAVWSLWDMGFRCVIAPSFGDIFYANCFQNGMLAIVLPTQTIAELISEVQSDAPAPFVVDLRKEIVVTPLGREVGFELDEAKRMALLEGLDTITMTLRRSSDIDIYQSQNKNSKPWLYSLSMINPSGIA
jgi:3-isopropylmalate/(R)-2-methylmalate dehydratase small subunit